MRGRRAVEPAFQMKYATRLRRRSRGQLGLRFFSLAEEHRRLPSPTGLVRRSKTLARVGMEEFWGAVEEASVSHDEPA